MKRIAISVAALTFVLAQQAFAETEVINQPTTPYPTTTRPQANINQTAKKSSALGKVMKVANLAAAGMFFKQCFTPKPPAMVYCAMGLASVSQAGGMGRGSGNADQIDQQTLQDPNWQYNPYDPFNNDGSLNGSNPSDGFNEGVGGGFPSGLAAYEQKFRDAGIQVSKDGTAMTMPDGQTVSTASIASGDVPGFEITDDVKKEADRIAEEALKKASGAKVIAVGTEDGGGGASNYLAGSGEEVSGSRFDMAKYLNSLNKRDPASVSGLSKKLGEDNIGIKSDNIFEMISRQYKRKQSQKAFIN